MKTYTDVEQTILEAAEQHFAEKGFHETVVADIADDADVGKGTVYRHFGHKAELFGTLIERASDELRHKLESVDGDGQSLEETVRIIATVHFDFFADKKHLMEVVLKEGLARTGDEFEEVLEKFSEYRNVIRSLLEPPIETLDGDVCPKVKTQLLISWIWGLFRDRIIFGLHDDAQVYADSIVTIFVEGLQNNGTS